MEKKRSAIAIATMLWGISEQDVIRALIPDTTLYFSLGNAGYHWERGEWRRHVPEWVKQVTGVRSEEDDT